MRKAVPFRQNVAESEKALHRAMLLLAAFIQLQKLPHDLAGPDEAREYHLLLSGLLLAILAGTYQAQLV